MKELLVFSSIVLCVILEAFFSGSEIALVSVSRVELRKREKEGSRAAKLLSGLLLHPERLLTTTLIGTNLATVTGSVIYTTFIFGKVSALIPFLSGYPEVLTVITFTPFTLTFGELIPKSLFQKYADRIAFRIIYPIYGFYLVVRPFAYISTLISKVLGREERNPFVTKEELESLVKSFSRCAFEVTERKILRNVLRLKEKTVGDIYVPLVNVVAVNADSSISQAIEIIDRTGFSKLPVYRERIDDIIGYISVTDLMAVEEGNLPVRDFLRPIVILPEYMNLLDGLKEFKRSKQQMAVVVDEFGSTLGIITVEDILEEIVGKIEDEFDRDLSLVRRVNDRTVVADGICEIEEVNRFLKVPLPKGEDYVTVAGLILKTLGRFPKRGEVIYLKKHRITVESIDSRRIRKIRIVEL